MSRIKTMLATALVASALSAPALAFHCPLDGQAIEKGLANIQVSDEVRTKVMQLHEEGMAAHNAGNHDDAQKKKGGMSMAIVFLDTETTGLDDDAQMVEIAVVDENGSVLFESYCSPTVPIDPGAQAVHGIGDDVLATAPQWPEISARVRDVLEGNTVVIFNAAFDTRILAQTAAAHGDPADWVGDLNTHCAMYRAADVYGATNRYGTISLVNAAYRAGIQFQGRAHSAVGDAATTAALWRKMAE